MHPAIPSLPAIWLSLPHCPIWLPATSLLPHHPCHLAILPHHPQQLPSSPPAPLPFPPSLAIWHSWPQLPVPSGSLSLPLLPPLLPPQSGPPTPTPPNIITKGSLHPTNKFEFFIVSEFFNVHFNLTLHGFNFISCENNIFHLTWKNSQNSREATPFPSIR